MSAIDLTTLPLTSHVSPAKAIAGALLAWLLWRDYQRARIAVSLAPERSARSCLAEY